MYEDRQNKKRIVADGEKKIHFNLTRTVVVVVVVVYKNACTVHQVGM